MSQKEEILKDLLSGTCLTGLSALMRHGTMKISTRCSELIADGYNINIEMTEDLETGKKFAMYCILPWNMEPERSRYANGLSV